MHNSEARINKTTIACNQISEVFTNRPSKAFFLNEIQCEQKYNFSKNHWNDKLLLKIKVRSIQEQARHNFLSYCNTMRKNTTSARINYSLRLHIKFLCFFEKIVIVKKYFVLFCSLFCRTVDTQPLSLNISNKVAKHFSIILLFTEPIRNDKKRWLWLTCILVKNVHKAFQYTL